MNSRLICAGFFILVAPVFAEEKKSEPRRRVLVELFTSQG
jgi:hypothetical protein